jgi:arylformamidase
LPAQRHCPIVVKYAERQTLTESPMPDVDYEHDYNLRARVPDHAEIFARWARDAEDYRAEALKRDCAELGLSYGDTPRQIIDLFLPAANAAAPLALFIHGGFWRAFDPSSSSHLARGLNARGIAVAVVGYDLCPIVTIGDITVQVRRACIFLWQRFGRRLVATGHSAGGHLAASMVGTDWQALFPKAPAGLVPAAYAISGIFDLTPLLGLPVNQDLRLDSESARRDSPLFWPIAPGLVLDAAVGDLETSEFKRPSATVAETWRRRGALTHYAEFPGNHFTVLDALTDPASVMVGRIVELAQHFGR